MLSGSDSAKEGCVLLDHSRFLLQEICEKAQTHSHPHVGVFSRLRVQSRARFSPMPSHIQVCVNLTHTCFLIDSLPPRAEMREYLKKERILSLLGEVCKHPQLWH